MEEMNIEDIIKNGESSLVEFKEPSVSPQSLADEIVAFSNVQGGAILIGVSDDGRIVGIDPLKKNALEEKVMNICRTSVLPPIIPVYENRNVGKKWIVKITIPEGFEKPYQTNHGKYLIRVGSTKRISSREELLRLFQNAAIKHIDDRPIVNVTVDQIDLEKAGCYFKDYYELNWHEMGSDEKDSLLLNSSVLANFEDKLFASIAGLIFFARRSIPHNALEKYLPHAGIQFVYYEDETMETIFDRLECYDPCPEAIDTIVHKIRLNWKTPSKIIGLKREEIIFPFKLFRELVVNAVVHRDYSMQAKIQIQMLPYQIRVISPGRLMNSVTIEKMKAGTSIVRNPVLMKFMQNYRYADQLGRGIPMILKTLQKMPGHDIEFKEEEDYFITKLTFPEPK